MSPFRLAHCSDPHLAFEPIWSWPGSLASKRSLSQLSWLRGRRELQRPEVLAAAVEDMRAQAPDHWLVTGDITNFSHPDEFRQAARWFATLGPPDRVSVIPGNHDALVSLPWADGLGHWQPWMQGEPAGAAEPFPYLRLRGEVAIIGMSSAVPTAPGMASGALGAEQLARLEALLLRLGAQGRCRVVALHHPPADGVVSARKALIDRAAFRAVLGRAGAELVLHGHSREARFDPVPGPKALIASLGLPSVSAIPNPKDEGSRWQLLEFERDAEGWQCRVTVRRLRPARDGYETAGRYRLRLAPQ